MNATLLPRVKTNPLRHVLSLFAPSVKREAAQASPTVTAPPKQDGLELQEKKKILIVDDDPVLLRALEIKLRHRGYGISMAVDGSSAIGAVRKEKPDLILLDINFPPDVAAGGAVNWDGFLIMSWLKRLEEARNIPVIIISAGDEARYKERSLAAGAIAFLAKPLNHSDLLSIIERKLGQRAPTRQKVDPVDFAI